MKFDITGSLHYRMIMPLLLITFVENCFKYGELFDPAKPVLIRLAVERDSLSFYTHNHKKAKAGHKGKVGGIGLANTRKRLELTGTAGREIRK